MSHPAQDPELLSLEAGTVDLVCGHVERPQGPEELTTKELGLLVYLVAHEGRTVSRDELLKEVWGFGGRIPHSRAPDFTMRRLRQKLEARPSQPRHLLTVHGEGYRFVARHPSSRPPGTRVQPSGAAYAPEWYAQRPAAEAAATHLLAHAGAPVVISGPARVGKTWFLDHLLAAETGPRDVVVRIEADQLEPAEVDGGTSSLEQLALELSLPFPEGEAALAEAWRRGGHERRRLTRFMESFVLPRVEGRLFVALDGADRWSVDGDPSGFFGMLRSWASQGRDSWDGLRLVLTISTDPALLVEDARLSPFNLAPPVRLVGLPRASLDAFASEVSVTETELDALHEVTAGHAELVRRALYVVATGVTTMDRVLSSAGLHDEPFGSFLRGRLEALRASPPLADVVRSLLTDGVEPDPIATARLVSAGVLARIGRDLRPSSPLLERCLRAHL